MRVGFGYDIHPLGKGRKLILGGLDIPHTQGLVGHSDADVLVHAVCDALLGAMGEGDVGRHYPSSDPRYKDISSLRLLDTVIIAQAPRLGPHLDSMRTRIAEVLKIEGTQVNVKVKSGEGLDAVGREEAIAAQAICLIETV